MAKSGKAKKKSKRNQSPRLRELAAIVFSANGESEQAFPIWAEHLRERKRPRPLHELLRETKQSPLLWLIDSQDWSPSWTARIRHLDQLIRSTDSGCASNGSPTRMAHVWLGSASSSPPQELALESLHWAHALPRLGELISHEDWSAVMQRLLRTAADAVAIKPIDQPWVAQLLLAELPLTLTYQFPEMEGLDALGNLGVSFLSESLVELLDGCGLPEARRLSEMHEWLSCWTRCLALIQELPGLKLKKAPREAFDWFVRQTLRVTTSKGGLPFAGNKTARLSELQEVFAAAIRWTNDSEDKALAKLILRKEEVAQRRLPDDPGYHSDWSEAAILQPEWDPREPRMVVTFHQPQVQAELSNAGDLVCSGPWQATITLDGKESQIQSDWETNCWFSDFDVDYLELEAQLSGGAVLQRQFLLARQDYFLYTADVVLVENEREIDYRLTIPLAPGIEYEGNQDAREGFLLTAQARKRGVVIPPALAEWRMQRGRGSLWTEDRLLISTLAARGRALHAPLFIDLHRQRMTRPVTWRQLTVGEELQIVRPDSAVAYRIQAGAEQWFVYRSLRQCHGRTALGQNISCEFVLGRFLRDGDVEPIIEIE